MCFGNGFFNGACVNVVAVFADKGTKIKPFVFFVEGETKDEALLHRVSVRENGEISFKVNSGTSKDIERFCNTLSRNMKSGRITLLLSDIHGVRFGYEIYPNGWISFIQDGRRYLKSGGKNGNLFMMSCIEEEIETLKRQFVSFGKSFLLKT